jgi:hypothetical protein
MAAIVESIEISRRSPPTRFGFRGIDGLIRAIGKGSIEPLDDGNVRA